MRQDAVQTPQPLQRTALTSAQPSAALTLNRAVGTIDFAKTAGRTSIFIDISRLAFSLDEIKCQNHDGARYRGVGLSDRFVTELRRMRHAAHKDAVGLQNQPGAV